LVEAGVPTSIPQEELLEAVLPHSIPVYLLEIMGRDLDQGLHPVHIILAPLSLKGMMEMWGIVLEMELEETIPIVLGIEHEIMQARHQEVGLVSRVIRVYLVLAALWVEVIVGMIHPAQGVLLVGWDRVE
jgi:hypothetical protein